MKQSHKIMFHNLMLTSYPQKGKMDILLNNANVKSRRQQVHSKFAIYTLYATATFIFIQDSSTMTNPTMEPYCFLLSLTLPCRTTCKSQTHCLGHHEVLTSHIIESYQVLYLSVSCIKHTETTDVLRCVSCIESNTYEFICLVVCTYKKIILCKISWDSYLW